MNLDFFILGGYGQFFWPAFIFAFVICLFLYLESKKELKKQEKIFYKEYGQLYSLEAKTAKTAKPIKEALSGSSF